MSIPSADFDGKSWTLEFASEFLEIPEPLLRKTVNYVGLSPSGTMNMRAFRSQGRTPRAYPARQLIIICEALASLKDNF